MMLLRELNEETSKRERVVGKILSDNGERVIFSNVSSGISTTASVIISVHLRDPFLAAVRNMVLDIRDQYPRSAPTVIADLEDPVRERARKKAIPGGPYKAAMVRKILKLAAGPMTPMPSDRKGFFAALKKA